MTIAAVKYEHAILLLGATNAKTHSLPVCCRGACHRSCRPGIPIRTYLFGLNRLRVDTARVRTRHLSTGRWPLAISIRHPFLMSATCPTRPTVGPRLAGWDDRDGPLPRPLRSRSARTRESEPPRAGGSLGARYRFPGPRRGGVRASPQPPRRPGADQPVRGLCEGLLGRGRG